MEKRNSLTGLYYSQEFFEMTEQFLKEAAEDRYCMMAIDIEHFELYNQIHGRQEGDHLLTLIGHILKQYVDEFGGVAGYMGGDNYAIVTAYHKERLEQLQARIREDAGKIKRTTGYPPAYGIYVLESKEESAAVMYHCATVALSYVIGNYTTRCCEYNRQMDGKTEEEVRLLSEIQNGIEQDEFTFYIQPQCDISISKIVGGESLVRWEHGEEGTVSPGVFVPVMERNGFIADLDQVVWEKVCQWLRSCIDRGYKPVPLSVNVSRIDIFSVDVPKFLISLVEKYELPPELIKIEITESAYAEDGDKIIETVQKLREYGFVVMMDDFGSGYSSLNMLKSVPVDVLKMDMRFLEINDNEEEKGIGILESVINMARQMRIPIVVEGVETVAQENLLKKMGCCYTQGYYYYKPMPISAFEEILVNDENLDHHGFGYRQTESIYAREFLDENLFSDQVVNNILGAAVFYEMIDEKIEISRVNEQYLQLAGIRREEKDDYRKRFWNSVRDDDRQLLYSIFEEAHEKKNAGASGFINFVRRDGKTLWVKIRVFFLREKENKRLFYASLTDMTDLKEDADATEQSVHEMGDLTERQIAHLERYYDALPTPFGVGRLVLNKAGEPIDYVISYANKALSRMSGGNMDRLRYLIVKFFSGREKEFLQSAYRAAFHGEKSQFHVYSAVSNSYFDATLYQYRYGYACCMLQDVTHSHIYESISSNIMKSFREVYFLHLQDNYCRMIYPDENDLLYRGNYEEVVSRMFDSGKIRPYDERGVREFLSLEHLRTELRKKDSIEYRFKRSVNPAGEEWCIVTVTVSERKNGAPKTATVTIRSIESLMRERESHRHQNMAELLGTMSDGFFIYSAEGEEVLHYANATVVQLFGCSDRAEFEELTGNTFPGMVHPEDLARVQREIHSQVLESDRSMDYIRYRIIRKDGEIRWIDDIGHLEAEGRTDGTKMFYVFITDVTDNMTEAEKKALIAESRSFLN